MAAMDHMSDLPALSWGSFFTASAPSAVWTIVIVALLVGYLVAWRAARRRDVRVPAWRAGSFVLGLAVLAVSVDSGIAVYGHVLFWMHMVQHLLLIMVVPALLAVGRPLTVLRGMQSQAGRDRWDRAFHGRVLSVLTHPLVGFGVYAITLVATHLSSFPNLMLTDMAVHEFEQVLYLVAGLWFLLPLLAQEPIRWQLTPLQRIFLLLVGMAPDTIVGIVLLQSGLNPFAALEGRHPGWGPTALADVHIAGGLMWALGDGLMMVFAVCLILGYVTHGTAANATAGSWLENIRRSSLAESVRASGGSDEGLGADIDDDEASWQAYNAMLSRLNGQSDPVGPEHNAEVPTLDQPKPAESGRTGHRA